MVLGEVFRCRSIHASDNDMVSFVRFKRDSLDRSELLLLKGFDLGSIHDFGGLGGVNAGSFDGDNEVASVLDEVSGVETENTSLIGLGDISEDNVNHRHEHSVLLGVSSILDDGDDVSSLLGHVNQVSARSLGELYGVHASSGTDEVSNMGYGSTGGSSKI